MHLKGLSRVAKSANKSFFDARASFFAYLSLADGYHMIFFFFFGLT